MGRAVILMMDSLGVGSAPDAEAFGDAGANTLGNIATACHRGEAESGRSGALKIPNLASLGLAHAVKATSGVLPKGVDADVEPTCIWGAAKELSSGKDTISGHWEFAGVPVLFDWKYFPDSTDTFPLELLAKLVSRTGIPGYLGNCQASGTTIINDLGQDHVRTGKPIIYGSADSVLQIAVHEQSFGLDRLYDVCQIARSLVDPLNVARVIARPFVDDDEGGYRRTANRRDYSVPPTDRTLLQHLIDAGGNVIAIGKIADIYAHTGVSETVKASGLDGLFDATLDALRCADDRSLVFTNFVDFDSEYGHRRDVSGYARALEYFDTRLPELDAALEPDDIVIITADHGCDPTWSGTDHTREFVPVIMFGQSVPSKCVGIRDSFADIGQTLAAFFDLTPLAHGVGFHTFTTA